MSEWEDLKDDCRSARYIYCKGGCLAVIIMTVVPLLTVPIGFTYAVLSTSATYSLYPGQTRTTSRSSHACQGVSISTAQNSAAVYSYLLPSPPPLGVTNNTFLLAVRKDVSPDDFQYWVVHFNPGSTYSMAACLTQGNSLDYFVKGENDFKAWKPQDYERSISDLQLKNRCGTSNTTDSLSFSSEDDYYFVVDNTGGSTASVQIWFSFNLTEYSIPEYSSIISNCTATGATSCSLDIPYKSDYIVLLKTDPPLDGRWDEPIQVTTSCVIRGWVYAVIESSMAITIILALLPFCYLEIYYGVYFCIRKANLPCRRRRPPRTRFTSTMLRSLGSSSTNVSVRETTSDSSPVESNAALTTPPLTASSSPPSYEQGLLAPPAPQSGYDDVPPAY